MMMTVLYKMLLHLWPVIATTCNTLISCELCVSHGCQMSFLDGELKCEQDEMKNAHLSAHTVQDCLLFNLLVSVRREKAKLRSSTIPPSSTVVNYPTRAPGKQYPLPNKTRIPLSAQRISFITNSTEKNEAQDSSGSISNGLLLNDGIIAVSPATDNFAVTEPSTKANELLSSSAQPDIFSNDQYSGAVLKTTLNYPFGANITTSHTAVSETDLDKFKTAFTPEPSTTTVQPTVSTTRTTNKPEIVSSISEEPGHVTLESQSTPDAASIQRSTVTTTTAVSLGPIQTTSKPEMTSVSTKSDERISRNLVAKPNFMNLLKKCPGASFYKFKNELICRKNKKFTDLENFLFAICKLLEIKPDTMANLDYAVKGFYYLSLSYVDDQKCSALKKKKKRCGYTQVLKKGIQLESYCPLSKNEKPVTLNCTEKSQDKIKLRMCKIAQAFIVVQNEIPTIDYFWSTINPMLHRREQCKLLLQKRRHCHNTKNI